MPLWNNQTALTFDHMKPCELAQFFEDLEQLFKHAAIKDNAVKKNFVVCYVDFNMEKIWKTFEEFKQVNSSYKQFRDAILEYYPDASRDFIYSLCDMDILIR